MNELNLTKIAHTARVDIKNVGSEYNLVKLTKQLETDDIRITKPWWLCDKNGVGAMVTDEGGIIRLHAHCYGNGVLNIACRCYDERDENDETKRIPLWVMYTSVLIDGVEQLQSPVCAWHDKAVYCRNAVNDGEEHDLVIAWQPLYHICEPKNILSKSGLDVKILLELFDGGAENIYLVDETGHYAWQSISKQDVAFKMKDGDLQVTVKASEPIVFHSSLDEVHRERLFQAVHQVMQRQPEIKEAPIVNPSGQIMALAQRQEPANEDFFDWHGLHEAMPSFPKGDIYVSSKGSKKLRDFIAAFADRVKIQILDDAHLKDILKNNLQVTLVYGEDLYPDIEQKISVQELYLHLQEDRLYELQREALEGYEGIFRELPQWPAKVAGTEVTSHIDDFLRQVEAKEPILLKDAYDLAEIAWMCSRLRTSKKYGSDNLLYLQYTSFEIFCARLRTNDWREILSTGKVVFLFDEQEKTQHYGKTGGSIQQEPDALELDEITELVHTIRTPQNNGRDFFSMILDGHPNLLTIGWQGLQNFAAIYDTFLKGKSSEQAIEHLRQPVTEGEKRTLSANFYNMLKYRKEERLPLFLDNLSKFVKPGCKYEAADWMKAFFLSVSQTLGRKFTSRISPALYYDQHNYGQGLPWLDYTGAQDIAILNEVYASFPYVREVGVCRNPVSYIGGAATFEVSHPYSGAFWSSPFTFARQFANTNYKTYLPEGHPRRNTVRMIRFEDLKLYPRQTIAKLCQFLRLPWSDNLLHLTTNLEDSGNVEGTVGFNTKPVYNKHLKHASILDYYRLELLNVNSYTTWGYKLKYYDGEKYTKEELYKLFSLPFKVEMQELEFDNWPDKVEISEFHKWIYQRALEVTETGERQFVDKLGRLMKPVECLFPELEEGQELYE